MKMKKLFLLLFICLGLNVTAQKKWNTVEHNYYDGVVLTGLLDVTEAKLMGAGFQPKGKKVTIKFDPFYDKYTIDWVEEDGAARMVLKFSEENSGGKMYIDTYGRNTPYFVINKIENDNKLIIMSVDPVLLDGKKVKLVLMFDDIK